MQVLIVFSSSELGGAERSLTRMALAPNAEEAEFHLATLDGSGSWVSWCHQQGAKPLVLGNRNNVSRHASFGILAILRLASVVRRQRYKVLYIIGLRASLWVRLLKPWLVGACLVHGIRWNPNSNSLLDRSLCMLERILGGLIDLYIFNSNVSCDTFRNRVGAPESKMRVIYNGIERTDDRCNILPLPERLPCVVVLANLNPRKGHLEFLDTVALVCKKVTKAHFYFVGRDDMDGQLLTAISQRGLKNAVTLTGYQSDISRWLDRSCLMVLPSLWGEGCPTSILEGHAAGLPVIAYAIDGVPELINHQSDGVLITPMDKEEMANAIVSLLLDLRLANKFGTAGRKKVESEFTIANCAMMHTSEFKNLLCQFDDK